jgi:hypothetical protein
MQLVALFALLLGACVVGDGLAVPEDAAPLQPHPDCADLPDLAATILVPSPPGFYCPDCELGYSVRYTDLGVTD